MLHTSSMRALLVLVAALGLPAAIALAPRAAVAEAGEITVHLKNGTVVRGVVVEKIPGESITLRLATGEIRKIRWSDIASDSLDKPEPTGTTTATATTTATTATPTTTTITPPTASPTAAPTAPAPGEGAVVHVEAKAGAFLQRFVVYGTYTRWEPVCAAPCDRWLPAGTYRVDGKGMRASPEFAVSPSTQPVVVRAKLGSLGGLVTGISLTSFGGLCLLVGVLVGATFDDEPRYPGDTGSSAGKTALYTFGILGGVMVAVGLPLWIMNGKSVEVDGREIALKLDTHGHVRLTPRGLVF